MRWALSYFPRVDVVVPAGFEVVEQLGGSYPGYHTWRTFLQPNIAPGTTDKKRLPLWSPARYRPHFVRGQPNAVLDVAAAVLDIDDGPDDPADLYRPWPGTYVLVHRSWTAYATGAPRWRVVLPFQRPVPASAWPDVWQQLVDREPRADTRCRDIGRQYFVHAYPQNPAVAPFLGYQEGALLELAPRRAPERVYSPPVTSPRRPGLLRIEEPEARRRVAEVLGRVSSDGRKGEDCPCPTCGRPSVWFWIQPGNVQTWRCSHLNSCRAWGWLDRLPGALEACGGL